ncbi:MAG: hypothetical protein LBQ34_06610 [Alphaproteobacteria bacterium]|jgi:hypothetical protein|nr:hypothetical protein [Alphaproteobacteria bacterium]
MAIAILIALIISAIWLVSLLSNRERSSFFHRIISINRVINIVTFLLVFTIVLTLGYALGIDVITDLVNYLIMGRTEESPSKPMTLTFLGATVVGNTALLTLVVNFKRTGQSQRQIEMAEEGAISATFKDAITLLGNENTSVRMGGVYTLIDMISRCPNYREKIHNIICQHIVYRSNVEYYNHLKSYGVSAEEARVFENISLLRTFYLLEKNDFKNDSNLYSDITNHRNFNNTYDLSPKLATREIYQEKLKDDDFENLIRLYDKYNNLILKCLDSFKSSDTIQEMINLVVTNNPNSYITKLSNIKIFNKDFIHSDYNIKNFQLDNAFIYKSKIVNEKNFRIVDTIIYKSQLSFNKLENLDISSCFIKECSFVSHNTNSWWIKGSTVIVGTIFHQPEQVRNFISFDTIKIELNHIYIKGLYTQQALTKALQNKKCPNILNFYFKIIEDGLAEAESNEEKSVYLYANYIAKDEDFEDAYEAYTAKLALRFEEVKREIGMV